MASRGHEFPREVHNQQFRFGKTDGVVERFSRGTGVKHALSMEQGSEPHGAPKTKIVQESQEAHRKVVLDHLGKAKSLMQDLQHLPPGHAHGIKICQKDCVGELLRGFYSPSEQLPDSDLGRCTIPGHRNFVTESALGAPTIRTDLRPPPVEKRSVANTTNFGDDFSAFGLIFPGKSQGLLDDDFQKRRTEEEIQGILSSAGYQLEPIEFEEVFKKAARMHGDGKPLASMEVFKTALVDQLAS